MSTEQPRIADRPLGESWVMASTASLEKNEDSLDPQDSHQSVGKVKTKSADPASESLTSSASSSWTISGPELIMPSICETPKPNPEGSWVEYVRTPKKSGPEGMRKRRKVSVPDTQQQGQEAGVKAGDADAFPSAEKSLVAKSKPMCRGYMTILRTAINTFLIAIILHLLVVPEVVYQAKDLCHLPSIKSLYPSSCVTFPSTHPSHSGFHSSPSPDESLAASQRELESILDTALETLAPLSTILKQSEGMLVDLETQLKSTFPDARNALDLEFTGGNQAVQTAVWEFDSLRADLRSAIDSLLASPPTPDTGSTIALDTRLANQMRRRSEYLDRLRAQIRSKADSLNTRFTTLDDHLEAVGIIAREERRSPSSHKHGSSSDSNRLHSMLDSLPLGSFGAYFFRARSSGDADANAAVMTESSSSVAASTPEPTTRPAILALLRVATTHHRPVADSVLRLSRQLRDVRRGPLGE